MLLEIVVFAIVLAALVGAIYHCTSPAVLQRQLETMKANQGLQSHHQRHARAHARTVRDDRADLARNIARLQKQYDQATAAGNIARADQLEAEIRDMKQSQAAT